MKFNRISAGMMVLAGFLGAGLVSVDASAAEPESLVVSAPQNELIVEIHSAMLHPMSDSVDALSDDHWFEGVSLGLGYDLSYLVLPGLRGFVLYEAVGKSQERFDGALDLDWMRQVVMVAADYGPDLWGFVRPSVRLGAGYATQKLHLTTNRAESTRPSDRTHDLAATGAVGLELYIPFGDDPAGSLFFNKVTFGLGGHVGYMFQTTAEFDELTRSGDSWQQEPLQLGELDMNGLYWNLGLTVRVRF